MLLGTGLAIAPVLLILAAGSEPVQSQPVAGAVFTVTLGRETSDSSSDRSSVGSSTDVDTMIERVLAVSDAGTEVEFDLPPEVDAHARAAIWQLPARVLFPRRGASQLLNREVLEARVDPWLKRAGWTRAQCGKGIFTWNSFEIECDPESILRMADRFRPSPDDLKPGSAYHGDEAKGRCRCRYDLPARTEACWWRRFRSIPSRSGEAVRPRT